MGRKPPAAIIIARHGARLDAADKNWHLTSPTPYDPPLSYGGWLQARALGARIISLLNSPDNPLSSAFEAGHSTSASTSPANSSSSGSESDNHPPKSKRRIIIHTSPYLRCLQTAVAVIAGISQYATSPPASSSLDSAPPATKEPHVASSTADPVQQPGPRNRSASTTTPAATVSTAAQSGHRYLLRVDAFLGEWLCPDYFEEITPPPGSERLIMAAKAELLRRGNNIIPEADTSGRLSTGHFPGGWGSFSTPVSPESDENRTTPLPPPNGPPQTQRGRAATQTALDPTNTPRAKGLLSKINTDLSSSANAAAAAAGDGYVPPTPSYAISPSDPIPAGYVTHARNACTKIDYQWDSMRSPQNWGNGGEYGEEWSAMHTRFRTGLSDMLEWYKEQSDSTRLKRHSHPCQQADCNGRTSHEDDDDDSVETVLILITHGAGCNALIGALTGEPVLLDFGTASLTLALRKDLDDSPHPTDDVRDAPGPPRRSSSEPPIAREYNLKLVASKDHLRPGVNPTHVSSDLPVPTDLASPTIPSYRQSHRFTSRDTSLSPGQFMIGPSPMSGLSTRDWMLSRPSTAPRGTSGLWSSVSAESDAGTESSTDDLVPNFGDAVSTPSMVQLVNRDGDGIGMIPEESSTWSKFLPQRTASQRGLWGGVPLNVDRDAAVKRRWTVTERRV